MSWPSRSGGGRPGGLAGQRPEGSLAPAARGDREGLPLDQPDGVSRLGAVPHGPLARDHGQEPSDGELRRDRRGRAQHRAAGLRVFNLAVIPFRDGINMKRLKKPLRRVIEPAITIGLVGLAFAFLPWLVQGGAQAKEYSPGTSVPASESSSRNSKTSRGRRRHSRASRTTRNHSPDLPSLGRAT